MLGRADFEAREASLLAPYAMRSARQPRARASRAEHPFRMAFQRDRDRIIHSHGVPPPRVQDAGLRQPRGRLLPHAPDPHDGGGADHAHDRRALRLNEDLAEAVALAHDLGHTPFGHAGERVLNELMAPHGGFEHNAPEPAHRRRARGALPDFRGLNLTWEVREGIVKHSPPYDKPLARDFDAGRGAVPRGADRRLRRRDRLQQPRHRRRPQVGPARPRSSSSDVALWRDAYRAVRASAPERQPAHLALPGRPPHHRRAS